MAVKVANNKYSIEQAFKELGEDIDKMTEDIQKKAKNSVQLLAGQVHGMIVQN
jgi:hypothetical protein